MIALLGSSLWKGTAAFGLGATWSVWPIYLPVDRFAFGLYSINGGGAR